MGDSNTPFVLTYDQSASASSRDPNTSPTAKSPIVSTQVGANSKSDAVSSSTKSSDDLSSIGARKRLLEERVFGSGNATVSSTFPVDASGALLFVSSLPMFL